MQMHWQELMNFAGLICDDFHAVCAQVCALHVAGGISWPPLLPVASFQGFLYYPKV